MIRLQRIGKNKKPSYRLVVSEKTRDPQAKSLEILGHYSPTQDPKLFECKPERIAFYIANGAGLSETVNNLLVKEGVIEGTKQKSIRISNKRHTKLNAAKEAVEAKKLADEEAKKAAKEAEEQAKKEAEEAQAEAQATPEPPAEEIAESEPVAEAGQEEATPEEKPAE